MSYDIDEILPYIGEFGRFQKIMIAMITFIYFSMAYEILIIYFSTMIPSWTCKVNSTICNLTGTLPADLHSRCDMPRSEWEYTEGHDYSLATQFNIKCDDEWMLALTSAIFFVGWGAGSIFFGWFGDRFGRKLSMFPAVAGIYLLTFFSAFMPNISLVIAIRFCVGFLIPAAIVQPSILITEIVGTKQRPIAGLVPQMGFPIGYCMLGLKAYFLRNWRYLSMLSTAPYVISMAFYFFIPESVRFLQLRGRSDDAMEILHRIAKWNKKTLPRDVRIANHTPSQQKSAGKGSLFKSRKIIIQTLIQGFIWLSSAMSFYGLHLAANDLDGSIYANFIYLGATGIPAVILDIYVCEKFGRRHAILIPLLISGIACFGVAFIPARGSLKTARVIFGILGKCFATASLEGLIVWSIEIFPTDVRSQGMGFVNVSARVGATSAPFVAKSLKNFGQSVPFIVMGIPALIGSGLGLYLPETINATKMDGDDQVDNRNTVIRNEAADL